MNGPKIRRKRWTRALRQWWHDYEWTVVTILVVLGLALGYIGWATYSVWNRLNYGPGDVLYLDVQLFSLGSGATAPPIPWPLQIARFLLPGLAAYTAFQALTALFSREVELFRLGHQRDHAIICGLGRKGWLLAKEFADAGYPVAVIESEETCPFVEQCRDAGMFVLIGNAGREDILRQARAEQARYVVAVTGDDGANAEIAVRCRQLAESSHRTQPLACFVDMANPRLYRLMRDEELRRQKSGRFVLKFFNVFDIGARALFQEFPELLRPIGNQGSAPHLLIVGLGRFGESVVFRASRLWLAFQGETEERLRVTAIDRNAEQREALIRMRYLWLQDACDLVPLSMDVQSIEFQQGAFLDGRGRGPVTAILICLDNEALALSSALTLREHLRRRYIPVIVRTEQSGGISSLLPGHAMEAPSTDGRVQKIHNIRVSRAPQGAEEIHKDPRLQAFELLDRTCKLHLLLAGTVEMLARALHEEYVRFQQNQGGALRSAPGILPWDELTEAAKEANRRQAAHIIAMLKEIHCEIVPLLGSQSELLTFTAKELERLAQMERRYRQKHRQDVQHQAAAPDIVPWQDLIAAERVISVPSGLTVEEEPDHTAIRTLPKLLAGAGFQIVRVGKVAAAD